MTTDSPPQQRGPTLDELLADEGPFVRHTLEVLGRVLSTATEPQNTYAQFVADHLGAPRADLVHYAFRLSPATVIAAGLVLADLIDEHGPVLGPDADDDPPRWTHSRLGATDHTFLADGTLLFAPDNPFGAGPLAIVAAADPGYGHPKLTVVTPPGDKELAVHAVAELRKGVRRRNPLLGRVLRARAQYGEVRFSVVDDFRACRAEVMVPAEVWREIDIAISAVTTRHEVLRAAGVSTSYGVMLAGRPGVGKTALTRAVVAELAGEFTVILAEPSAAADCLAQIYAHTEDFGPMVVVLDDIDLYVRRRGAGDDTGLGELLSVLDGAAKNDRVLTIATTNDPMALDSAATRASRFDSVIELDPPSDAAAEAIITRLLGSVARADVDVRRVVSAFPAGRTGADLTEAVRRAIVLDGHDVTTATLLRVIGSVDYAATLPIGTYL